MSEEWERTADSWPPILAGMLAGGIMGLVLRDLVDESELLVFLLVLLTLVALIVQYGVAEFYKWDGGGRIRRVGRSNIRCFAFIYSLLSFSTVTILLTLVTYVFTSFAKPSIPDALLLSIAFLSTAFFFFPFLMRKCWASADT